MEINLFHVSSHENINDFLRNKQIRLSNHPYDDKWLGCGMYFWDNLGNANFWKLEKEKKSIDCTILKCPAFIEEDDLLDLTDNDILNTYEEIINQPMFRSLIKDEKYSFGQKIDFICSLFHKSIVKGYGKYQYKIHDFLYGSRLTNQVKCVYCIKQDFDINNLKLSNSNKLEEN